MRTFRAFYDESLRRRPLLTKMITSSVFFGLGNRVSQRVEEIGKTDEELAEMANDHIVEEGHLLSKSAAKTVRMMVWGGFFVSPIMHNWYNFLDKIYLGSGPVVTAKKVVSEMIFIAPVTPILFLTTTGLMAGKTFRESLEHAVHTQPTILQANYCVWPAANSINFTLVPLQYRLLFNNFINLGWSSFISRKMTDARPAPALASALASALPSSSMPVALENGLMPLTSSTASALRWYGELTTEATSL